MTTSDQPRRLAFELPKKPAGNKTSSVVLAIGSHTFKCKPTIDGITLLEFAALAGKMGDVDENDTPEEAEAKVSPAESAEAAAAILKLLQTCIVEWDKFEKLVKDYGIGIEQLGEYAAGLVGQYTDRPQKSPQGS